MEDLVVNSLNLKKEYFEYVISGLKTVEGRINNEKFKRFVIGSYIKFNCENKYIICKILNKTEYNSFKSMLENEGIQNCLPNCNDINEAIEIYRNIGNYRNLEKNGVIAIKFNSVNV